MNGDRFILTHEGRVVSDFDTMEQAQDFVHQSRVYDMIDPETVFEPLRFYQVDDETWESSIEGGSWRILVR